MKPLKLIALCVGVFYLFPVSAQLNFPSATSVTSSLRSDIQKVVAEYPSGFANMRGEVVASNPQSVEYISLLKVEKAETCTITKYSSLAKPIYSCQAVMLTSESFEEAAKKYKWLFGQVKGMNVKYVVDQYTLTGRYEAPVESMKFTVSTLTVADPPEPLKKLKVEVGMRFEFPKWKVTLTVFEKEREDDEQGEINDF
ncbi:MAG: hypothetical protein M3342_08700 [Bacteroidota bacterium]|nr:hypothetical protein [Bacteroidota bacterium]